MADSPKFHLHHGASGAAIAVRVVPKSKQNRITEISKDGTVTVQLNTPDYREGSNQALVKFLSETLKVPATGIEIVAGLDGQDKLVTLLHIDSDTLQDRITKIASN